MNGPWERKQHGRFDETRWSLIDRVVSEQGQHSALDELLHIYMPALRTYLVRRRRIDPDRAEDLLQDFILSRILEKDLIRKADRTRGRFRSLLLSSLDRFLIDRFRRESAQKRSPGHVQSVEGFADALPDHREEGVDAFDSAWARTVLRETLRQMWAECRSKRETRLWKTFCHRILIPLLGADEPTPYAELAEQLGFDDERQASNALITARRMFDRNLRRVIGEYAPEEQIEDEAAELHQVLLRSQSDGHEILPDEVFVELRDKLKPDETPSETHVGELFAMTSNLDKIWEMDNAGRALAGLLDSRLEQLIEVNEEEREQSDWSSRTPTELLTAERPPLELLIRLKDFGRGWTEQSEKSVHRNVGAAVYFLAIAAARLRLGERITRSNDSKLRNGLRSLSEQKWVDEPLREILRDCLAMLEQ